MKNYNKCKTNVYTRKYKERRKNEDAKRNEIKTNVISNKG